jgi:hypothetical protein
MNPKVLVACPTYSGKAYALDAWAKAYQKFSYQNKEAFLVDNSPETLDYTRHIRFLGLACTYQAPMATWWDTLDLCWLRIIERAHEVGAHYILSLEQDIIAPFHTIEVMLLASGSDPAVVTHRYRPRGPYNDNDWYETLGCTLIPTDLLYPRRFALYTRFEVALFNLLREEGWPLVRLQGHLDLCHLEPGPGEDYMD